jgi:ABC-2 type transport system permease protein
MAVQTLSQEGVTRKERSQLREQATDTAPAGGLSAFVAILQRELMSSFYSPIAYVVGFIFLLVTGYIFVTDTLQPGSEASMRSLFEWMAYLLVFAVPILTMRSVADEFATGAIESLMTAPVTDAAVILGKFVGTLLFYIALLATTIPHLILMQMYSKPVFSVVVVGYLGMILLGALFIAVGIFASACTKHQLLAAIISITVLCLLTFGADRLAERGFKLTLGRIELDTRWVGAYSNILGHFSDFSKGIIDSGSLIFFLTGIGFFLFLAIKVLESRRWR